jgi:hypothetical protein
MLFKFCFHKFIIFDKYRPLNTTLGVLNIVNAAGNYLKSFFDSSASLKYVRDTNILRVCKAMQENQITFFVRYNLFTRMSIYLLHTEFVSDLIRYQNACPLSMIAMEEQEQFSFKVKTC